MSFLTRAEALCALRNLQEAIEMLDEILPADFSSGVHDRAKSMHDTILAKPQYERVTENQDRAIRNMWTAVQKWNRKGQANREMFHGLADVQDELTQAKTAPVAPESAQEPPDAPEPEDDLPEGLEDAQSFADSMMAGLEVPKAPPRQKGTPTAWDPAARANCTTCGQFAVEEDVRNRDPRAVNYVCPKCRERSTPVPAPAKFVQPGKPVTAPPAQPAPARLMELCAKARENVIAWVYNRFREKNVRVIEMDKIKHGDVAPILKMTASDRTQQLLDAAYFAGYISGARSTIEEIQELLKKE